MGPARDLRQTHRQWITFDQDFVVRMSDVLIANLRGVPAAQDWLLAARRDTGSLAVSAVSLTEVAGRMRFAERRQV